MRASCTRYLAARAAVSAVILLGAAAGLSACGDDDDDGGDGAISVTLSEWIVEPDPASADAGEIEFEAQNDGGEVHELVVVRAASADALPTDADGAVDEDSIAEKDVIGEIEDIEADASKSVTFDLEAGTYVLFCNITEEEDDGSIESHFEEGMHATFTVE